MIDPATIMIAAKSAVSLFKAAKEAVDLIPDPVEKATALGKLALLEKDIAAKDTEIAKGFGYELCLAHVPIPGIMRDDGDYWRCTVENCGRSKLTDEGRLKENKVQLAKTQRVIDDMNRNCDPLA